MKAWSAVGLVCVFFATVVCGGGGGGGASTTNSTIQITWGDITRSTLTAPTSARSVRLVFQGAGPNGTDTEMTVNRGAFLYSYTDTYPLPPNTAPNGKVLSATFRAGTDPSVVVATATATMNVSNNSVNLANISLDGKVKTVVAQPLTMFKSAGTASLQFTALDQANNILAVAPGSAKWSVVSGDSILSMTPDGIVSGLKAGQTNVKATVDGIDSQPVAVSVNIDFVAYEASVYSIDQVAFAPDGKSLSSTGNWHKTWNPLNGGLIRGNNAGGQYIAYDPTNSSKFAFLSTSGVTLTDLATNSSVYFDGQIGRGIGRGIVALSPDGSKIASIGQEKFGIPLLSIRVWDVSTRTMIWKHTGLPTDNTCALAFSPDGLKLAYGGHGNEVTIFNTSNGSIFSSLRANDPLNDSEYILGLSFSPDGKYLATTGPSETNSLDIWDLTSLNLKQTVTLPDANGDAYDVKFSPDGELLAAASISGKIYLYPTSSYTSPKSLVGHSGICFSLDFSPSDRLLASGGLDKRIRIWCY
jgi:WD40 repeat protein